MALYRSRRNRIFGGVCGGIAEWLGWNPTAVRILYVVSSIVSAGFPGTLVYLILWARRSPMVTSVLTRQARSLNFPCFVGAGLAPARQGPG